MTDLDRLLSEFVDAWNAGERPRVEEYVRRASPAEQDELTERLGAWLLVAPSPSFDESQLDTIRAEPAFGAARAAAFAEAEAWPVTMARARRRARVDVRELAQRVTAAFGLGEEEARVAELLGRLERGELDDRRVSRRLVNALVDALGNAGAALREAAIPAPAPAPSVAWFRADADAAEAFGHALDALSRAAAAPAPEPMDEVERLFCGGPDA